MKRIRRLYVVDYLLTPEKLKYIQLLSEKLRSCFHNGQNSRRILGG